MSGWATNRPEPVNERIGLIAPSDFPTGVADLREPKPTALGLAS
jgi:hypothetical protein